jgi:hypothetical protein
MSSANAVLLLDGLEDLLAALLQVLVEEGHRLPALVAGEVALVLGDAQLVLEAVEHALLQERPAP